MFNFDASKFISTDNCELLSSGKSESAIEIIFIEKAQLTQWLESLNTTQKKWIDQNNFTAEPDQMVLVPNQDGAISLIGFGVEQLCKIHMYSIAKLSKNLPSGTYTINQDVDIHTIALGWCLAHYKFDLYLKNESLTTSSTPVLELPEDILISTSIQINSIKFVRKLISTPAEDMGPSHLSTIMEYLAKKYQAEFEEILDEQLLSKGFNTIYTVGRAANNRPRLLELNWGNKKDPKVTLVGKGVCFDTGGLDVKPSSGMRIMKKDMGGAAHCLGLAQMIMAAQLKINLRLLIPAVENNISGDSFRPGDIIKTYQGTTVEVDNTDAEGRLVLCDALSYASEEDPELLIDFATLTGAARVAMGLELVPFFTDDDSVAKDLIDAADSISDPIWRMPLYQPYAKQLKSNFADIKNLGSGPYGGAIVASLFLKHFVTAPDKWIHFDLMAWNSQSSAFCPEGGEAMAIRGVFQYLQNRFH